MKKLLKSGAIEGNVEQVCRAIDSGIDVNIDLTGGLDALGYKAIHWAARHGHIDILHALIASGVDIESGNTINNTALHIAVYFNHSEFVKELLLHGAKVNVRNREAYTYTGGHTPLHYAVRYSTTAMAELLLKFGANVHIKHQGKVSPLEEAQHMLDKCENDPQKKSQCEEMLALLKKYDIQNDKDEIEKPILKELLTSGNGSPRSARGRMLRYLERRGELYQRENKSEEAQRCHQESQRIITAPATNAGVTVASMVSNTPPTSPLSIPEAPPLELSQFEKNEIKKDEPTKKEDPKSPPKVHPVPDMNKIMQQLKDELDKRRKGISGKDSNILPQSANNTVQVSVR